MPIPIIGADRTKKEYHCGQLSGFVSSELSQTEVNVLMGMLLAAHRLYPDTLFWEVINRFAKQHARNERRIIL